MSRKAKIITTTVLGMLLLAGIMVIRTSGPARARRQIARALVVVDQHSAERNACQGTEGARPVYPFSVIRGGVCSGEELEHAAVTDPAVAMHYSDVTPARFRLAKLERPLGVYVSYRRGSKVYWTGRRVWLAAKEYVLTDGTHHVRARCGNRISTAPMQPTAPEEEVVRSTMNQPEPIPPRPAEMVASNLPRELMPGPPLPVVPVPPTRPRVAVVPRKVPPIVVPPRDTPPLVVTPEPSTFFTMGGAALACGTYLFLRSRRRKNG